MKKLQTNYYNLNNKEDFFFNIKIARLPVKNRRYTVLKSPHVNKNAREQFELREHKCIITLKFNNTQIQKTFLNFLLQ